MGIGKPEFGHFTGDGYEFIGDEMYRKGMMRLSLAHTRKYPGNDQQAESSIHSASPVSHLDRKLTRGVTWEATGFKV